MPCHVNTDNSLVNMSALQVYGILCLIISIICFTAESKILENRLQRFILDGDTPVHVTPYVSNASLTFKGRQFYLDGRPLRILSGSLHYFRIVPEYWRDRLLKMKACGLNTVQIYVPWNLHEEYPGEFNFKGILNLRSFVHIAQEVGLYVIFRPGPYICAEWEFGGLPAWLLKDPSMKVRSSYKGYTDRVHSYFNRLLREVVDLQHHRGGPIIAVQVENEFGSYSNDTGHLKFIKQVLQNNGIKELFLTSDGYFDGSNTGMDRAPFYNEALPTANFMDIRQGFNMFDKIKNISADFPLMVTEFWSGWFDQWGDRHHTTSIDRFGDTVASILSSGASINFYMFHGGTTFGFMTGANFNTATRVYMSDVTSYDYDALLTEAGDITHKYLMARNLISKHVLGSGNLHQPPPNTPKALYGSVSIVEHLEFDDILKLKSPLIHKNVLPMESLNIHEGNYGQNFGFILYRTNITSGSELRLLERASDRTQVLIDGESVGVFEQWALDTSLNISDHTQTNSQHKLDIIVENRGRVNFMLMGWNVLNEQRKGLTLPVLLDGKQLNNWEIFPLNFSAPFLSEISSSKHWIQSSDHHDKPAMYRGFLDISGIPDDTFLWMMSWSKGFVAINGFNIGRYWSIGPQETLFVPAPLLKTGQNEILIFEQHGSHGSVVFRDSPILG